MTYKRRCCWLHTFFFLIQNTICLTPNSRFYLCDVLSLNSHSSSQSHVGIRAKDNATESTLYLHCVKDRLSIMSIKVKYFVPNYWNGVDEYKQHCHKPVVGYISGVIRINFTHLTPSHIWRLHTPRRMLSTRVNIVGSSLMHLLIQHFQNFLDTIGDEYEMTSCDTVLYLWSNY